MCMKKNNNRLLRGVAAVLCLALMFLTMSGMAMATDMEDAPAGGAPESTPEIVEAELPVTPEETPEPPPAEQGPDTQEPAPAPPETTETPQPEAEYALDADIPAGWHNAPVTITVRIVDKKGTGWNKAEAALGENAQRTDLTEQLAHIPSEASWSTCRSALPPRQAITRSGFSATMRSRFIPCQVETCPIFCACGG